MGLADKKSLMFNRLETIHTDDGRTANTAFTDVNLIRISETSCVSWWLRCNICMWLCSERVFAN